MQRSETVRESDLRRLLALACETMELPPDVEERGEHLLRGLADAVDAPTAAIIQRGLVVNWDEPLDAAVTHGFDAPRREALLNYLHDPDPPDLMSAVMQRLPAPVSVHDRHRFFGDRAWYGSPHYERVRSPLDLDHSLYVRVLQPGRPPLGVGFYRPTSMGRFTERDRRLIELFCQAAGRVFRWETPGSVPLDRDLPRRLRPVLALLLEGEAPKRIAYRLGLTPGTVYQYTKLIYRHYDVAGRGELLARFIGRGRRAEA